MGQNPPGDQHWTWSGKDKSVAAPSAWKSKRLWKQMRILSKLLETFNVSESNTIETQLHVSKLKLWNKNQNSKAVLPPRSVLSMCVWILMQLWTKTACTPETASSWKSNISRQCYPTLLTLARGPSLSVLYYSLFSFWVLSKHCPRKVLWPILLL